MAEFARSTNNYVLLLVHFQNYFNSLPLIGQKHFDIGIIAFSIKITIHLIHAFCAELVIATLELCKDG